MQLKILDMILFNCSDTNKADRIVNDDFLGNGLKILIFKCDMVGVYQKNTALGGWHLPLSDPGLERVKARAHFLGRLCGACRGKERAYEGRLQLGVLAFLGLGVVSVWSRAPCGVS